MAGPSVNNTLILESSYSNPPQAAENSFRDTLVTPGTVGGSLITSRRVFAFLTSVGRQKLPLSQSRLGLSAPGPPQQAICQTCARSYGIRTL